ncbi:MAG: hypothetical protein BroJett018_27500 [Chloroflexota bacterium]|nr:MAG: hypothetical protein BroJett018_27500 [Chloroflexota bacterium]
MLKLFPRIMLVAGLLVIGFALGYVAGVFDRDNKESDAKPIAVQTVIQTVVHTAPIPPSPDPSRTPRPTIDYSVLPTVSIPCGNHRTCGGMSNCEQVFACY